jgi:uncharacterized membrane protein (DUF373 family)
MKMEFLDRTLISKVEMITVAALKLLLIALVAIATITVWILFVYGARTHFSRIDSLETLQPIMQRAFAGVLTVVLGLELLETLRAYFHDHHVKLEVILIVAIIAVGRHVIQVDFEHTTGSTLLGLAGVILALTLGYFLVSRARKTEPRQKQTDPLPQASVRHEA